MYILAFRHFSCIRFDISQLFALKSLALHSYAAVRTLRPWHCIVVPSQEHQHSALHPSVPALLLAFQIVAAVVINRLTPLELIVVTESQPEKGLALSVRKGVCSIQQIWRHDLWQTACYAHCHELLSIS